MMNARSYNLERLYDSKEKDINSLRTDDIYGAKPKRLYQNQGRNNLGEEDLNENNRLMFENIRLAEEIQKKNKPNTFNNLFGAGQPEEPKGKKMVGRDSLDAFLSRQVASGATRPQAYPQPPEDPRFEENLRKFYGRDTPPVRQGGINNQPNYGGYGAKTEELDDRAIRKFYGVESQEGFRAAGPGGYSAAPGYAIGRGMAPQRLSDPMDIDCANFLGLKAMARSPKTILTGLEQDSNQKRFRDLWLKSRENIPGDLIGNFFGVEGPSKGRSHINGPARRYKNDTSIW